MNKYFERSKTKLKIMNIRTSCARDNIYSAKCKFRNWIQDGVTIVRIQGGAGYNKLCSHYEKAREDLKSEKLKKDKNKHYTMKWCFNLSNSTICFMCFFLKKQKKSCLGMKYIGTAIFRPYLFPFPTSKTGKLSTFWHIQGKIVGICPLYKFVEKKSC